MLRLQNMFLVSFIPYISCFVFFFPCLLCFLFDLCTSSDMRDMLAIVFAELPWLTASCASYPGLVSTWHLDSTAWLSVIGTSPSLLCLCFAFALPLLCLLEPELKVVARSLCSYFCLAVRSQLLEDANVRRTGPCSFACSTAKVRFENIWIDLAWFGIFSGSAIRYYPWLDAVRAASGRGGSCQLALLFGNGFLCAVEINSPQHSAQSPPKFHLVLSHGFTMFHHSWRRSLQSWTSDRCSLLVCGSLWKRGKRYSYSFWHLLSDL